MFIAAGQDGAIMSSNDGSEWKSAVSPVESLTYRLAGYGNGTFLAIGSRGPKSYFASSSDGRNWSVEEKDLGYKDIARGMAFGNERFLAFIGNPGLVSNPKPKVSFSESGADWTTPKDISGRHMLRRAAYGNGIWAAIGDRGRYSWSEDGEKWTDVDGTSALDTMIDIIFANGLFVATGLHGARRWSEDGRQWSPTEEGKEGEHINSVLWTGEYFIGIGAGATYISPDGKNWERRANESAPTFAAYADRLFVGVAYKGIVRTSQDATTWEQVHKENVNLQCIASSRL